MFVNLRAPLESIGEKTVIVGDDKGVMEFWEWEEIVLR